MPRRILSEDGDDDDDRNGALDDTTNGAESDQEGSSSALKAPQSHKRAKVGTEGRAVKREFEVISEGGRRSSVSALKRRASGRGDAEEQIDDDGERHDAEDEDDAEVQRPRVVTQARDTDGYVPGSIVRMKLTNFLTYDDAEFRPGPYLNMVLGPNGTGKSSIACAICLGLGFPPKLLGRAADIHSFVKIGATTSEACIEIELKGPAGKKNVTITRKFKAGSDKSDFTINGQSTPMKDVAAKVRELNVQVDNLCSFLPQDRVVEFAGLSPVQLLHATQVAAGEKNLVNWHNSLKTKSKDLQTAKNNHNEVNAKLEFERSRNERIKAEVERYEQRERVQEEISFWEAAQPYVQYAEAKVVFDAAKGEKRKAQALVRDLSARDGPLNNLLSKWKGEATSSRAEFDSVSAKLKSEKDKARKIWTSHQSAEEETTRAQMKIDQLENEEKARKTDLTNRQREIEALEKKLASPPPVPEDEEAVQAEAARLIEESAALRRQRLTLDGGMQHLNEEGLRVSRQLEFEQRKLAELSNATIRRISNLQKWDAESGDVALWLHHNQDKFVMQVLQPPCVSLSVPKVAYQTAVEGCISAAQMKMFVPQCKEDYDTFNRLVNDGGALKKPNGKTYRVNVWFRPQTDMSLEPIPREQIVKLGFECFALDQVECADGMRWFLQAEAGLHRTPIALQDDPSKDMSSSMQDLIAKTMGKGTFVVGTTRYTVARSSYGQKLAFMTTTPLNTARNFKENSVSPAEVQKATEQVQEAQQKINRLKGDVREQKDLMDALASKESANADAKSLVDNRQKAIQNVKQWTVQHTYRLERARNVLNDLLNAPPATKFKDDAKRVYSETLRKRTDIIVRYKDSIFVVADMQQKVSTAALKAIQALVNHAEIDRVSGKQNTKLKAAVADLETKSNMTKQALEDAKQIHVTYNAKLEALEPHVSQRLLATPPEEKEAWTSDMIYGKIEIYRNELEANLAVNGGIVDQYKRREKEIQILEGSETRCRELIANIEASIHKVRSKWYPALKVLVNGIGERFSAAFDRMGCAGELRVTETEDYANWSLDILVKFRSSENLQQLTAQRQSGGERSLTTILYLMSLTEYARAPFSLVDEINQGMDHRAERAVHDQLVEVTCRGDAGQYFLITPKLLPDLNYHKRMRILCINNGDWLPDERIGSLKTLVDNYALKKGM